MTKLMPLATVIAACAMTPSAGGQVPLTSDQLTVLEENGDSKFIRTAGLEYEGAIVRADAQLPSDGDPWLGQRRTWTPSDVDVREAEAQLRTYIHSRDAAPMLRRSKIPSELSRYKRQYWGTGQGRSRDIQIRFYHDDSWVVRDGAWLVDILTIKGGGEWFFRVTYRVEGKRFRRLAVNGPE